MTLHLELTPSVEAALAAAAAREGMAPADYAVKVIERETAVCRPEDPVRPPDVDEAEWQRRLDVVAKLRSIALDRDPKEQRETMDYLIRTLDEDRPADRKLFPAELKGISW
jgi:hypothetical protein